MLTLKPEDAHLQDRLVAKIGKMAKVLIVTVLLAGCAFIAVNLFRGTWMVTPVLSGSMRPGFAVGGVVISQRTPLRDIAVRDVIVFENPYKRTEQMIHRIIKLTREPSGAIEVKTKGDANPVPDPWTIVIRTRDVYQIKASVPLVGYVAVAYQNHRAYFVMAAGLLILLSGAGTWMSFLRRSSAKEEVKEEEEGSADAEPEVPDPLPAAVALHVVGAAAPQPVADGGQEPEDGETPASAGRRRTEVGAPQ